jgi:hypothetical protein
MDIEINTPNLLSCKYCGSVVPVSLINAPSCHWQVEFSLMNTLDIHWYMTLKEFLAKLNQLVYLHVYVYLTTIMVRNTYSNSSYIVCFCICLFGDSCHIYELLDAFSL